MRIEFALAFVSAGLATALAVASMVAVRKSIDRWAFIAGMLALAAENTCRGFLARAGSPAMAFMWEIRCLMTASVTPGIWLLFSLTYARGHAWEFLKRWWIVVTLAVIAPALHVLVFRSSLITSTAAIEDIGSPHLLFRLGWAGWTLHIAQLLVALLILMNLERTFRAAVGTVRWRIKFMLLGVGIVFLMRIYISTQALLFHHIDPDLDILRSATLIAACLLILRSFMRARNVSLEVYPSQSVLQGSITILLVGIYLLVVGVLAKIVTYLGGDSSFTLKTLLVLVLFLILAVLLQSDRVQLHLRRIVSRHFQRPLHDYRSVWRRFTEATASQIQLPEFCRAVVKLIADIFQSLSVSLWIINDRQDELSLAASTSVTDAQAKHMHPTTEQIRSIIAQLTNVTDPVSIEHNDDPWAVALRACHPDQFHRGGPRMCVPVVARGELLAVILLGDRVGGAAFTVQDLDLLKSTADQVASGLISVRLSERLLQAREHEAFQAMATFFVHDLKNAASTLNLMLRNLPDHFDDPAFREDALRGVGKSVNHINHLISRLGELRHELKITPVRCDLNAVVAGVLTSYTGQKDFSVEWVPQPVPTVLLDRDQFVKVITNLVINAREACSAEGRLRISTQKDGAWVVVQTNDNGCGMSPEFLNHSLFRPFQTTKKNGLGIGMFQSKMIVEAHGGRMIVESTPGQGTSFRVFLPVARD